MDDTDARAAEYRIKPAIFYCLPACLPGWMDGWMDGVTAHRSERT
ncbi:hypothetical protein [Xylella fastidiosa]|nr:hypothetical protein [Xylella fastidiosa]